MKPIIEFSVYAAVFVAFFAGWLAIVVTISRGGWAW